MATLKRTLIAVASGIGLFSGSIYAQSNAPEKYTNQEGQTIHVITPTHYGTSIPVRDLPLAIPSPKSTERKEVKNNLRRQAITNPERLHSGPDPLLQTEPGKRFSRAPIANFDGQSSYSNPPDPSGAASATHYVHAINTQYGVYDKSGNLLSGPHDLSTLWSNSINEGDPIVMYDKHADRWFISQFQQNGNQILVAVSKTNDPTGEFHTYSFSFSEFPDYPKYSIWWDGYYMTSNSNHTAVVFEREKMLNGEEAKATILTASATHNYFKNILPADADGELPPNGTPCYFFNLADDSWGGGSDKIEIFKMVTDWNTPSNTAITSHQTLNPSAFDTQFDYQGGYDNLPQKGTSQKIDAVPEIFYYRAQYRKWSGYNSVMLCHVVDVNGNDRAGIRWYELRDNGSGTFSIHQEGTYAPAGDNHSRFLGSISMDDEGNIGLAYCVTGSDIHPSIRYTGRFANDEAGKMTLTEETAVEGNWSQNFDRFGDYSHMCMDPDGKTFWFTGQYNANNGQKTRVFSFRLAEPTSTENIYHQNLKSNAFMFHNELHVFAKGLYDNQELTFDIFDIKGMLVKHSSIQPANNQFNIQIPANDLRAGTYLIRFGNENFQKVHKVMIKE